eukprot:16355-Heterococcus_DN1.PRE.1
MLPYNFVCDRLLLLQALAQSTGTVTSAIAVLRAQAPSRRHPMPAMERKLLPPDFALFALCGGLGCVATHSAVIPLDVVKTRMQTAPAGRYSGLTQAAQLIVKEEGPGALLQGAGATMTGYLCTAPSVVTCACIVQCFAILPEYNKVSAQPCAMWCEHERIERTAVVLLHSRLAAALYSTATKYTAHCSDAFMKLLVYVQAVAVLTSAIC